MQRFEKKLEGNTDDYKTVVRMYRRGDLHTPWDHRVPLDNCRLETWVEEFNRKMTCNHLRWQGRLFEEE